MEPILDIQNMQHDHDPPHEELRSALREFRCRKEEELGFVRTASGLSAAAAIAVFSWPTVENSFWLVKIFWNWSLMASIFSLISSAQQRLLREFPKDTPKDADRDSSRGRPSETSTEEIQALLDLVLSWPPPGDAESKPTERPLSFTMIWIWQTPMMLMSYAWLLFLLGYALHLLTPIFDGLAGDWSSMTIPMASVTTCVCFGIFLNFLFCSIVSRQRMRKISDLRRSKRRLTFRYPHHNKDPRRVSSV